MNIKRNIIFALESRKKDGVPITQNVPIRMRVIFASQRIEFTTGYRIDIEKWDANKQRVRNGCTNKLKQSASEINAELLRQYTEIQNVFKEFEVQDITPTPAQIKEVFNLKMKGEKENNEEKTDLAEINDEELNSLDINMNFLGLNLAQIPTRSGDWKAFIIPVLYVLVSVISLRITNPTPKKKDGEEKNSEDEFDPMAQMNKNMNLMFPVMYLAVALIAPLGLALYWLMNSLLMIIERLALNKMLKDEEE